MCGVTGLKVLGQENATELVMAMLVRLQHRGQDGAGLSVWKGPSEFETIRGLGLIEQALKDWERIGTSRTALAHTRYTTTGVGGVAEVQPFVKGSPRMALAHNGNIVNTDALRERFNLKTETRSDLDVLQQVFLHEKNHDFLEAVKSIMEEFHGGYAVVGIENDGTLFGFRDPFGIRPLYFAHSKNFYTFASETVALEPLLAIDSSLKIEEVAPGAWIRAGTQGIKKGLCVTVFNPNLNKKFCMFEIIYFSSPKSEYEDKSVFRLRFDLGTRLATEILSKVSDVKERFDFVVPVPETSRTAAIAVAEKLALPYREYLVKNPYVPRTFIMNKQSLRLKALSQKLSLIGPEIRGKKVLLVDDSVVRGNTSRVMASRLKEAGALSVSVASTCPPIRYGCYYGIDFPDRKDLVAFDRSEDEVAKALEIDGLYYLSIEGLLQSLGRSSYCLACLDGKYPTPVHHFESFSRNRMEESQA